MRKELVDIYVLHCIEATASRIPGLRDRVVICYPMIPIAWLLGARPIIGPSLTCVSCHGGFPRVSDMLMYPIVSCTNDRKSMPCPIR